MSYGLAIGLDVSAVEDNSPPLKLKTILTDIDPDDRREGERYKSAESVALNEQLPRHRQILLSWR